ncbi:MAG TPA: PLD nuclease N-terminal domain-containing protein [Acidimicrobiales bacterium]|nr:PLD nuclease N-terminal domain-containing protein [Acidimicrobiales bacterium]
MLLFDGAFGLAMLGLWVYCIFDVITTDDSLVRNLPKLLWVAIVLLIPDIGSIAWLVAGRPQKASFRIAGAPYGPARETIRRPDDGPRFDDLDGMNDIVREREERSRLRMWEEQLRRREEELRKREEGLDS